MAAEAVRRTQQFRVRITLQADERSRIGDGKLPTYLQPFVERMGTVKEIRDAMEEEDATLPVQCTVNDYPRGAGMAPHIDTHSAFSGM